MRLPPLVLGVVCVVLLAGCATTTEVVPAQPVTRFELGNAFFLKVDFDDSWRVYREGDPQNAFTDQFKAFRKLGLTTEFIALTKDGMIGARSLSQTSVLSLDDFVPLLKGSLEGQIAGFRNEQDFEFKHLAAHSWDYDSGTFTFHDLILLNAKKVYRLSFWMETARFEKYRPLIDQLIASIDILHE